MKKLLVTLIILCGCAVSAAPTLPWQKQPEPVKPDAITEQAKILYAQNEIDSALEILKGVPRSFLENSTHASLCLRESQYNVPLKSKIIPLYVFILLYSYLFIVAGFP